MSNKEKVEKKEEESSEEDFDTFLDNCAEEMKTLLPAEAAKAALNAKVENQNKTQVTM